MTKRYNPQNITTWAAPNAKVQTVRGKIKFVDWRRGVIADAAKRGQVAVIASTIMDGREHICVRRGGVSIILWILAFIHLNIMFCRDGDGWKFNFCVSVAASLLGILTSRNDEANK